MKARMILAALAAAIGSFTAVSAVSQPASAAPLFTCSTAQDCWFQNNDYTGAVDFTNVFNTWRGVPSCWNCGVHYDQSVTNATGHALWLKNRPNGTYTCVLPHDRRSLAPPLDVWTRFYQSSTRTTCGGSPPLRGN